MKRVKSAVWRFFERLEEDKRCVGVLCKLCENQYKYFGNTTNLRSHLINKHPIQWELSESGTFDETSFQDVVKEEPSSIKKKYGKRSSDKNVGYSVSINEDSTAGALPRIEIQRVDVLAQNSDSDQDDDDATTMNMVRQMHGEENSAEEWLEEDPYQVTHIETYEPKPNHRRVKYRKIKREVQSPTDIPGYYVPPKPEKRIYQDPPQFRKDEYSVFGEYVANKLRKLKMPRTQGNLQQLITTLLWQAEYGLYDSAEAVKRVLMISVTDQDTETGNNTTIEFTHSPAAETVIDTTELSQSNIDLKGD